MRFRNSGASTSCRPRVRGELCSFLTSSSVSSLECCSIKRVSFNEIMSSYSYPAALRPLAECSPPFWLRAGGQRRQENNRRMVTAFDYQVVVSLTRYVSAQCAHLLVLVRSAYSLRPECRLWSCKCRDCWLCFSRCRGDRYNNFISPRN